MLRRKERKPVQDEPDAALVLVVLKTLSCIWFHVFVTIVGVTFVTSFDCSGGECVRYIYEPERERTQGCEE